MHKPVKLFLFCLLLAGSFSANCYGGVEKMVAYLDPGTGAFIFQMLIAGIVGFGFAIKLFWYSIKKFFMSILGKTTSDLEKDERTNE